MSFKSLTVIKLSKGKILLPNTSESLLQGLDKYNFFWLIIQNSNAFCWPAVSLSALRFVSDSYVLQNCGIAYFQCMLLKQSYFSLLCEDVVLKSLCSNYTQAHATTLVYNHKHTPAFRFTSISINIHANTRTLGPLLGLNKNPTTTPDMHHPLSWPPRNILQGCQGNSLGNSSPACHSRWGKRLDEWR